MTNKKTFLQTATLIEDILGVKKVRVVLVLNPQHKHINTFYGLVDSTVERPLVTLWWHTIGKP